MTYSQKIFPIGKMQHLFRKITFSVSVCSPLAVASAINFKIIFNY